MRFKEIVGRLTGISTAVFGVSWSPPESERDAARRVIAYLEDRRVLYVPSEVEMPEHCVQSVQKIRAFLTGEMGKRPPDTLLIAALSAMRAACRKFLERVSEDEAGHRIILHGAQHGHYASWVFIGALGELRGVFGVHVAAIAAAHGLDVEAQLAAILPAAPDGN